MKLTIPRIPCSPNALLGKHWSAKAKEKKEWQWELVTAANPVNQLQYPKGKVRVTITIHNSRQYDRDNAWGACKPILDAMKQLGLIVDDRAEFCELEVRQEKSTRKLKHTTIEIWPL